MRLSPHVPWADPEKTLWKGSLGMFQGDLNPEAAHESIIRLGKSSPWWQVGPVFLDSTARIPFIPRLVGFESHVKYLAITQKFISTPREKTDGQCLSRSTCVVSLPLLHKNTCGRNIWSSDGL